MTIEINFETIFICIILYALDKVYKDYIYRQNINLFINSFNTVTGFAKKVSDVQFTDNICRQFDEILKCYQLNNLSQNRSENQDSNRHDANHHESDNHDSESHDDN
jgi:hypothetical protein